LYIENVTFWWNRGNLDTDGTARRRRRTPEKLSYLKTVVIVVKTSEDRLLDLSCLRTLHSNFRSSGELEFAVKVLWLLESVILLRSLLCW